MNMKVVSGASATRMVALALAVICACRRAAASRPSSAGSVKCMMIFSDDGPMNSSTWLGLP